MQPALELLFGVSILSLLYVYAGFPLVVLVAGKILNRVVRKKPIVPPVSLIIAAYNEEREIAKRLRNALALSYPADRLEILVASDGSTDDTAEIVRSFRSPQIRLLNLPRQGKMSALVEAVRHARGEILVFSDANSIYERSAIRALVASFADPAVGGVAGHTRYHLRPHGDSSAQGEDLYWSYDTWLKSLETATGSVISAHGGIYAIRRELFERVADPAVTDDFAISTAVIEKGRRLVFEPRAVAYEATTPNASHEFRRRVRLMTRGLRSVLLRRRLLNPFQYGFYSHVFFTHKILRRLLPFALGAALVASVMLAPRSLFFAWVVVVQAIFYAAALAGWLLRSRAAGRWKVLYVPYFYCFANLASVMAIINLLRGERITAWQPQRHPVHSA